MERSSEITLKPWALHKIHIILGHWTFRLIDVVLSVNLTLGGLKSVPFEGLRFAVNYYLLIKRLA